MQPLRFQYGHHAAQFIDLYGELGDPKKQKLVVMYHGGFFKRKYGIMVDEIGYEASDYLKPLAEDLVREGCLVANVEYCRVGHKLHDKVLTAEDMIRGVLQSYDYLQHLGHWNQIVTGHSAGGYYALMLGLRRHFVRTKLDTKPELLVLPNKIITQAAVTDLYTGQFTEQLSDEGDALKLFVNAGQNILAKKKDDPKRYKALSPINYTMPKTIDTTLFHGVDDKDVPLIHSLEFSDVQPSVKVQPWLETDHYSICDINHPCWRAQKKLILS